MAYSPDSDLRKYSLKKIKKRSRLYEFLSSMSVVKILIGLNILFFVISIFIGVLSSKDCSETLCKYFVLSPSLLFQNNYWWTLLSSIFLHSGIMHLFVNMLSLYFIGNFLEMLIGKKRFFWFYIFAGLFAGLFYSLLAFSFGDNGLGARAFGSASGFALGASGAIFGIAGVLAVLTPKSKVYLIAGPLIAIILQYALLGLFDVPALLGGVIDFLIFAYILLSIISMMFPITSGRNIALPIKLPFWLLPVVAIVPLILFGMIVNLPIGNMAHLGGFIAGALYGFYLRFRYKKKTQMIDKYFSNK